MKRKSVIYKLLITFSSITTVILVLIGIFLSMIINRQYLSEKRELIENYIGIIEESTSKFINNNDEVGYKDLINTMKIIKLSVNMDSIVVDSQGYVYEVSDEKLLYLKYRKIDIKDSDLSLLKENKLIEKDFINESNKKVKVDYYPLFGNGSFNGIIILIPNNYRYKFPEFICCNLDILY